MVTDNKATATVEIAEHPLDHARLARVISHMDSLGPLIARVSVNRGVAILSDIVGTLLASIQAALNDADMPRLLTDHHANVWTDGSVECRCGQWRRERDDFTRSTGSVRTQFLREHAEHQAEKLTDAILGHRKAAR